MSLKTLADQTVGKINAALHTPLNEAETKAVSRIVEDAFIKAVNESTAKCGDAAVVCCGHEADLAHKIAEDVERARYALLANLGSMR
mgnify:CR=1 FL=1